jgi:capsular exopolysaccharide synthesis family protein
MQGLTPNPFHSQNDSGDALSSLRDLQSVLESFWGIVRRRLWLVLLLAAGLSILATYQASRRPVLHRAVASVLLEEPPRVVDKVTSVKAEELVDSDRFANAQMRIITSGRLATEVEARLKMRPGSLAGRINVELDRNAPIVTLQVDDGSPRRAVAIVNGFVDAYMSTAVSSHAGVAANAAQFLDRQTDQHRQRLEADERRLYEFQRANGLPASTFEQSHRITSSKLESLHGQLSSAVGAGIQLKAQLEEISAALTNRELLRRLVLTNGGERWSELHAHYLALVEQAALVESRYGPKHPKTVELASSLQAVRAEIERELSSAVAALEARARANLSEQLLLRAAIAAETSRAVDLRQKELEYNQLRRQLDEDRDSYELVAKRYKEIEIQSAMKRSYVRLLDYASVAAPLPRHVSKAALVGLLLGLLGGVALAFGLDLVGDTLRSPQEAEQRLAQPVLGFVSSVQPASGPARPELDGPRIEQLLANPRSVVAEQCHSIATNAYSLFLTGPPRALAVVSSGSNDGKTFLCTHLAVAAAARGKRVLLIDGDLRRGRLHTMFRLTRGGGLYELATEQLAIDGAARATGLTNVDVMTCGEIPEKLSPLRVLELQSLRRSVELLKQRYDLLVFDTAPVGMVSDALVMRDMMDGALGVFRASRTSTRSARELARQLAFARINFLGWILNDVSDAELRDRYYYRKLGYGDAYFAVPDASDLGRG